MLTVILVISDSAAWDSCWVGSIEEQEAGLMHQLCYILQTSVQTLRSKPPSSLDSSLRLFCVHLLHPYSRSCFSLCLHISLKTFLDSLSIQSLFSGTFHFLSHISFYYACCLFSLRSYSINPQPGGSTSHVSIFMSCSTLQQPTVSK